MLLLRDRSAFLPLILINVLTNPLLNLALLLLFALTGSYTAYAAGVVIGEAAVFVGEAFLLRALCTKTLKRAFLVSTAVNAVSLVLGSLIAALI